MSSEKDGTPKISPKYNDDSADTKLISSDGVKFYIESFHLMSGCKFFRELMKDSNFRKSDEPLVVAASAEVVELFLDTITTEDGIPDPLTMSVGAELVQIIDLYGAERCRTRLSRAIGKQMASYSVGFWTAFAMANLLDDTDLAEQAMRNGYGINTLEDAPRQMDPTWVLAGFMAIMKTEDRHRAANSFSNDLTRVKSHFTVP